MTLLASQMWPARRSLLGPARAAALGLARYYLGELALERFGTAFSEATANACLHGSPKGEASFIWIRFFTDEHDLYVIVSDSGAGFDPEAVPPPDPEHFAEHGYGVSLMRACSDSAHWRRGGRAVQLGYVREEAEAQPPARPG